jgi:hypothetical protein
MTEEQKARAIEMYRQFVETGQRPEGGRRRAISVALGAPYKQVMKTIREWARSEHQKSPTPVLSREQLFEIEKLYWDEIKKQEHRLGEIPEFIANQLGYATRWQVLRWLDTIHDDGRDLARVPDPPPATEQQILEAYAAYLAAPVPPEQGLHRTIAGQLENVTPQQVYKVLLHHRHQVRSAYPLT